MAVDCRAPGAARLARGLRLLATVLCLAAPATAAAQTATIAGTIAFLGSGSQPDAVAIGLFDAATGTLARLVDHRPDTPAGWSFELGNLPPGAYKLSFTPSNLSYLPSWWQDQAGEAGATVITLAAGDSFVADPSLEPKASVAGTVTFRGCDPGYERLSVFAYRADTGALADSTVVSPTERWRYAVGPLPAGEYLVEFAPAGGTCTPEWSHDAKDRSSATAVPVADGAVTPVSPSLGPRTSLLLLQSTGGGEIRAWRMDGTRRVAAGSLSPGLAPPGAIFAGAADFNADRETDLLWRGADGSLFVWLMDGLTRTKRVSLAAPGVPEAWDAAGPADFNADGKPDLLWRNRERGDLVVWFMDGVRRIGSSRFSPAGMPPSWSLAGSGDFDGDRAPDLLWHDAATGALSVWYLKGTERVGDAATLPRTIGPRWEAAAVGDLDADGRADVLWRDTATGALHAWLMDGVNTRSVTRTSPGETPEGWVVAGYAAGGAMPTAAELACEACHDGSVAQAPDVMRFWYGTRAGQDGGHGDADGRERGYPADAPPCESCHDVSLPAGTHLDGTLQSFRNGNTNENTSHLRSEFFTKYPANAPGPWSVQVAFDNYCYRECHASARVADMRHEKDTWAADPDHGSVKLGTHLTKADGDLLPPDYPMDADLNTGADASDVDYVPCVSCHDPHGTGIADTGGGTSNRMLRDSWRAFPMTLCNGCHD